MNELITLCITIFLVRILDVSLGTIRTIFVVKGKAFIGSVIGFFEVLVWFLIVREALNTDITSIWVAISYAFGFAVGTYIGGFLSEKFIRGSLSLKVVLSKKDDLIIAKIREKGYAVTVSEAKGKEEDKYLLFIEINKNKLNDIQKLIKSLDSKAFVVINETKYVQNGFIK